MRHAVSNELYAYWDAIRRGRSAPERSDIEPSGIRAILADTFVLDLDNDGGFPFRIAGSRASALFLTELRGWFFLRLWREAGRESAASIVRRVGREARPCVIEAEARPAGLDALRIEVALLPLRHHGSTEARLLGSIAVHAAPHWLGLIGAGPARLIATHAFRPGGQVESPKPAAIPLAGFVALEEPRARRRWIGSARSGRTG
jgi:hypothetical protein